MVTPYERRWEPRKEVNLEDISVIIFVSLPNHHHFVSSIFPDCPCIGEKPVFLQDEDLNGAKRPVIPIATSGEVFPWNNVRLPTFAHPLRYVINIHPNLTTLDVKGKVMGLTTSGNRRVVHRVVHPVPIAPGRSFSKGPGTSSFFFPSENKIRVGTYAIIT